MSTYKYDVIPARAITDKQIQACSHLFSNEYGVWDVQRRVRLSPARLREQCLFNETCFVVIATKLVDGEEELVGHAFATRFRYGGSHDVTSHDVTWITQLVVSAGHRSRGRGIGPLPPRVFFGWRQHMRSCDIPPSRRSCS